MTLNCDVKSLPDLDVIFAGARGRAELVPALAKEDSLQLPNWTVPFGLPPVLPTLKEELTELLSHPQELPIHDAQRAHRFWKEDPDVGALFSIHASPAQTTLSVDRNSTTGKITGFKETILQDVGATAKTSTSMKRPPGPPSEALRGSATNYPFWPGGLDEPMHSLSEQNNDCGDIYADFELIPPGLSAGVEYENKHSSPEAATGDGDSVTEGVEAPDDREKAIIAEVLDPIDKINLAELMKSSAAMDESDDEAEEDALKSRLAAPTDDSVDEMLKVAEDVIHLKDSDLSKKVLEWAELVDINSPVDDFHRRIPDMAYKWDFELDIFQKQAILHLEARENVFVAAHTSAGKTVVAEYAIALSMKHMTRTIYTSPIKALSNQKFRDFKKTFGDVGLVTGDVQLRPEAACLIMTTEILRSMLYNGSDVIRDLEYVIFDEVHYINDAERGVVWEEVLIMLPAHISIILLSATVPNTLEFADWVGRTKKKKMFVVSTSKRPVPLEHFLYTGNSKRTSDELFQIIDKEKHFLTSGYNKAVAAKKERANTGKGNVGAKGPRHTAGGPPQERNVWLSLIEMLKKKDKLPFVAFTFSKKRINDNAELLKCVDLATNEEKAQIHMFFQRCMQRLKGGDRNLPQVRLMEEMLKRGIGVHHSGVLPILKEVVEMLFSQGLVKLLFATETFAMGVNMPARTVVFDSIRKHDGYQMRDLVPSEYIQMAGRAGRRGLDTTGMVIILCKGDVPETASLYQMMLGKPLLLESKFRLTYTMILNLLRIKSLRVQDMMKRSFSEVFGQSQVSKRKEELRECEERLSTLPEVIDFSGDLGEYYELCDEYWKLKMSLQKKLMNNQAAVKSLTAGRIVIIDNAMYSQALAIILGHTSLSNVEKKFNILIHRQAENSEWTEEPSSRIMNERDLPRPIVSDKIWQPDGTASPRLLEVYEHEVTGITTSLLKVAGDKITEDFRKRELPRFKSDPPSQSTSVASQELLRLIEQNRSGLPLLDPLKDLKMRELTMVEELRSLQQMSSRLASFACIKDQNFIVNFEKMKVKMKLKEHIEDLRFLMSEDSLKHHDEYQERLEVLKRIGFIDESCAVQLKGRVACEVSNHELILTELVFENKLSGLHATEIAALLSCTVFEIKNCDEPSLSPELQQAKEEFLSLARHLDGLQKDCGLKLSGDYVDNFRFGIMEVVFEWARGMPFEQIATLNPNIQEGIIVRTIQRLDEVIRDVRKAARIVGDTGLYQKMEEASLSIKRDIVFAASLYTQ